MYTYMYAITKCHKVLDRGTGSWRTAAVEDIVRTADSCLIETIVEAETAAFGSARIIVSYAEICFIMKNDP